MSEHEQELAESTDTLIPPPTGPDTMESGDHADPDVIEVRLKTLEDREATVMISKHRTLTELVDTAREQLDITTGLQRIIFQGRVLDANQTIDSAGIEHGHTVHLVNRTSSTANERPNVAPERPYRQINNPFLEPSIFRRSPAPPSSEPRENYVVLPPIRVPAAINNIPVLSSRFDGGIFYQETMPLRLRTDPQAPRQIPRDNNIPPFSHDPHVITWTIKIFDDPIYRPREDLVAKVEFTVKNLPFMDRAIWNQSRIRWNEATSELRIDLPQTPSHIPSPALEKLDFMCFWTENLKKVLDKVNEDKGLVATAKEVLSMAKSKAASDGMTQNRREQRVDDLDVIVRELELISSELSHQKDYERDRFKRNTSEEYRNLKQQEYPENQRNPRFIMRHALDIDFTSASREFRKQQVRFAELEELLDEILDAGAMKYAREIMSNNRDYRYQTLSMMYHYVQRMRHQVSHIAHIQSELEVSFLTPGFPQRLLPQYSSTFLTVPLSHAATIVLKFVAQREGVTDIPITRLIEPPRVAADVGDRQFGDWPYLPFNPPGVHADAVLNQNQRRMADPRTQTSPRALVTMHAEFVEDIPIIVPPGFAARFAHGDPAFVFTDNSGMAIQNFLRAQQDQIEAALAQNPGNDAVRMRLSARPRRVITTGDAPSIPIETMPPPVGWVAGTNQRGSQIVRYNLHAERRGPSTQTLSPLPVQIEQSELQRIARTIASRYREDALRRIAASLTAKFHEESWDTRLQNMPMCTLRESIALCLELLASAGSNASESNDLMLALVRDEDVLVRAIAESVKSLFGRGEFPTHLARIIVPRNETASARTDYESVDGVEDSQADELDSMVVRVASDISQPQSGDLRAIRERRASRRQFLENRARIQPSTSGAASSTVAPGPSFNQEDEAQIRAGRLPLTNRSNRRMVIQPATAATPIRSNSPSVVVQLVANAIQPSSSISSPSATLPITSSIPGVMLRRPQMDTENSRAVQSSSSQEGVRRSSAPPTVTNSPSRGEPMEAETQSPETSRPTDPARAAASERARAARAHIDRLAAMFTGPTEINYLPGTRNPRTERSMAPPEHSSISNRPMAAIDPFMVCGNRHCEINRLQNHAQLPDAERYTLQSLQPDSEFENHLAPMRPTEARRPQQTSENDEDYNYDILHSTQGSVGFRDVQTFCRFVRTICRSILSHAIDTDTLVTLNMNNISGYVGANHQELMTMVRRHVNMPQPTRANNTPFRPGRPTDTTRGNPRPESPIPDPNEIYRQVTEQVADVPQLFQREAVRPPLPQRRAVLTVTPQAMVIHGTRAEIQDIIFQQVSACMTFIVDYMENRSNPRPPGVFGFLLEITFGRFTRHDYSLLPRRTSGALVLSEYGEQLKAHILAHYLEGRTGLSNLELQRLAERIANSDTFFVTFLNNSGGLSANFQLQMEESEQVNVVWAFRQIEVSFVKALLTLGQIALDSPTLVRVVIGCCDRYLYRNLLMFWHLGNRDRQQQKAHMHLIPQFFASMRFDRPNQRQDAFLEGWRHLIDYWFDSYPDLSVHEAEFNEFMRASLASNDWNDAINLASSPPAPSPNFSSATASIPAVVPSSVSASSSNTVANPNPINIPASPFVFRPAAPHLDPNVAFLPGKRNHDGRSQSDDSVDVVAPLMSLSTSSPLTSSTFSNDVPATDDNQDVEMEDATHQK